MSTTRKLAIVGASVVAFLGAGVAFAAWTITGTGAGTTKATTAVELSTHLLTTTTPATLYPGGTGNALFQIRNDNPFGVNVTSIVASGPITSDKGAACDASTGVTFTSQSGTFHVNGGASAQFTFTGAVAMSNASDNSCQGALFTIPVTLTGVSG